MPSCTKSHNSNTVPTPRDTIFSTRCLKADEKEPVIQEELVIIAKALKDYKAPGPGGIPNNAMKLAIKTVPVVFKEIFDACLAEEFFPKEWKIQKFILLPKGKKPSGQSSSYRPICLLDTKGKVLKRIMYNRLLRKVEQWSS